MGEADLHAALSKLVEAEILHQRQEVPHLPYQQCM